MKTITVTSAEKNQITDITEQVKEIVSKSKIKEGVCTVYTSHATCGIIINENYDPNVMTDIISLLQNLIPEGKWLHDKVDNNAAAHIKSAIIGPSETIPIENGRLTLGKWQDIMLADWDGPRKREVIIKIING